MQIHPIDLSIIIVYLIVVVILGILVSRRAGQNIDSYFLGGKRIPWYLLGVANASGMFDITGTMWLVTIFFVYGLKSTWIPWLWPTFNQIFLMIYLAAWLRRSKVMTGAAWIRTRFGNRTGAELSHISVVFFALVSVIGFLAYAFQGIGKFAQVFFPWDLPPEVYAMVFMGVATIYVIMGGMLSVVITDLIQFSILTVASVFIAGVAIVKTTPAQIAERVPEGWNNLFFGWKLDLDWSGILDSVNQTIATDGYSLFGIFFMMILFKGVLASAAGPAPNYDMQKILSTRSPKEAAMMSFSTNAVLYFPRYLLIAGIAVLGLVFFSGELAGMGSKVDFEQILPFVIKRFVPVGLVGLVLAGLLAAFMSTFDCTVNAGASYVVNDLYKRYINPGAGEKTFVYMSYVASIVIVIVGIGFGFMTASINKVLQWIVAGLYGGYIAPNVLKWYWWRFNGYGYFAGMITGVLSSLFFPIIFPGLNALESFPFIFILSMVASIAVSFLTRPESDETLIKFYRQVRPWGLWGPVYRKVMARDPDFRKNRAFWRDMINVSVGIVWQTSLVLLPVFIVLRETYPAIWTVQVLIITSLFLKKYWYDRLEET
jgi:Na+/proline symporter